MKLLPLSPLPSLHLSRLFSLQPVNSEKPVNMENLPINNGNGQSFGYTLYETTIASSGVLSGLVRDRGQVGTSSFNSCDLVVIQSYHIHLTLSPECSHTCLVPLCRSGPSSSTLLSFSATIMGIHFSSMPD